MTATQNWPQEGCKLVQAVETFHASEKEEHGCAGTRLPKDTESEAAVQSKQTSADGWHVHVERTTCHT